MTASYPLRAGPELSLQGAPQIFECADSSAAKRRRAARSASITGRRGASARVPIGLFLYLASVGVVGAATVGLFFGSAFSLLTQPREQVLTAANAHDRDSAVDPLRSSETAASAQDAAPPSEWVPTSDSILVATTTTGPEQTTALTEPASNPETVSTPPLRGGVSDRLRKLSRLPNSQSNKAAGRASAAVSHLPLAKQDQKHEPEEYAAASANQREYHQLQRPDPP